MAILSQLLSFVALVLACTGTFFAALFAVPLYAVGFYWGQWTHWFFGKCWIWAFGIHVKAVGLENLPKRGEGMILVSNHESMIDIPLLASLPVDFRWVSKEEVGKIWFLGAAMRMMGCYFVKRNQSGHDINVMKEVEEGLKKGNSVLIFPEGTRTRTGELLPFKKGAFRAAINSGAPLVPIALSGTYEVAPPGKLPQWGKTVRVRVGKPVRFSSDRDIPSVMEEYKRILINLLAEDRGPSYDIVSKIQHAAPSR
jgi:1-acyl-sn-glycerol-3-phosphate acyltransferase